jgi:hypothetical protein
VYGIIIEGFRVQIRRKDMKKKLFLAMLCAIGLCISLACSGDFDAKTDTTTDTRVTSSAEKGVDTGVDESEQQFFRNQKKT